MALKVGSKRDLVFQAYAAKIKEAYQAGNQVEMQTMSSAQHILMEIPSKRPRYCRTWTAEQVEEHFRKFYSGIKNGTVDIGCISMEVQIA